MFGALQSFSQFALEIFENFEDVVIFLTSIQYLIFHDSLRLNVLNDLQHKFIRYKVK